MISLPNLPFAQNGNSYSQNKGSINYLDGQGLLRPQIVPKPQRFIMILFVIAAAVVAAMIMLNYSSCSSPIAAHQDPAEQIATREVDTTLPSLVDAMSFDTNEALKENYNAAGILLYDVTSEADASANAMDIVRIPSDLSQAEANSLLARGIANLNASQATSVLYGSWRMNAIMSDTKSITLSYADFKSQNADEALASLYEAEGFAAEGNEVQESSVDESGTTLSSGTMYTDTATYTWEATVIPLTTKYEIEGLSAEAQFVTVTFQ